MRLVGLLVDEHDLRIGKLHRVRVEGEGREKKGWYYLHEVTAGDGDLLIVGSFGVFRGADHDKHQVKLPRDERMSRDQIESLRRRLKEDRKRAEQDRAREHERAALAAAAAWAKCSEDGDAEYLHRKGVGAHGVRFSPGGALVIPLIDTGGKIHGLQVIRSRAAARGDRRKEKEFWPAGLAVKGHFHLIGTPVWVVIIAEGYATAASIHEATGLPVAVAWSANNIAAVARELRQRYKRARILIAGDDDNLQKCRDPDCKARIVLNDHPKVCPHHGGEHRATNAGMVNASAAAMEVGGAWLLPTFYDEADRRRRFLERGAKVNDFNDLHAAEGLHLVRVQIERKLHELGWAPPRARSTTEHEGPGKAPLQPIETLDELLERYALVYGAGGTVFDRQEHCMLALGDMRDACITRDLHRAWAEHPDRSIVRLEEVGFDPTGLDDRIQCNLWGGWPTVPREGKCDRLLELLYHMCTAEAENVDGLFQWVLKWIAYPLQHPGAKMKTTVVIHGPQGTGKNMFYEALMKIYGEYGRIIDQSAIEDRFNDWASKKLFLIADEVVARSDLYHVKNKLKAFITGDNIRINPKNMAAYNERNHVNIVFLSNEQMPVVLEEDDRRHAVIWTPKKLGGDYYRAVLQEIQDGGIAALHHYLLNLDLGEFDVGTLPPMTAAKAELIQLSLDSTSRFHAELTAGEIGGVRAGAVLSQDLYELYKSWCNRSGHRAAPMPKLVSVLKRRHEVPDARKRYLGTVGMEGPHGILFFNGAECPPGATEAAWLGEEIRGFRLAINDYKGGAHA
ncbi:DUF5906 domain-containing protein [Flagellatimonas centrodinii]|uniref:DUF5906 domain-containing protein n=1 Tax=Flagellatimonas centrodinii TaxID=2806210 RepID=UPI001FED9DCF|nr:DUF5906 domain-containing protein [Flagellatimonas centrodinii]ULQ45953.1 DUF5906 domain-containing protein [Flagellatimonas centrodinii]